MVVMVFCIPPTASDTAYNSVNSPEDILGYMSGHAVLGARARVCFSVPFFLYFIARIARTPSLFFVNIMKNKPP